MKKNIILIMLLILALNSVFTLNGEELLTDDFYSVIIPLLKKNPQYENLGFSYKLERRKIMEEKLDWLPKLSLGLKPDLSGVKIDKNYYNLNLNSNLNLSQKIPLDASLSLFAKQNNNIFFANEKSFDYNFSTGANLNFPAWFLAPSLFDDYAYMEIYMAGLKQKKLDINIKEQKRLLIIKTIVLLTKEKILKNKLSLVKKLLALYAKEKEKNELLFSQGKLSSLEFIEFNKKNKEKALEKYKIETEYYKVILKLNNLGLTQYEIDKTLEDWLLLLEDATKSISFNMNNKTKSLLLENKISWLNQVNKFSGVLPKIVMGCNFDFIPQNQKQSTFSSSIKEYWKNKPKLRWSVFMAFSVNLNPFSSEYRLNKSYKLAKKINYINESAKLKELNKLEAERRRELKAQNELLFLSKSAFDSQKKYLKIAEDMYKLKRISNYELMREKYAYQEAELNYFIERYKSVIIKLELSDFSIRAF